MHVQGASSLTAECVWIPNIDDVGVDDPQRSCLGGRPSSGEAREEETHKEAKRRHVRAEDGPCGDQLPINGGSSRAESE